MSRRRWSPIRGSSDPVFFDRGVLGAEQVVSSVLSGFGMVL